MMRESQNCRNLRMNLVCFRNIFGDYYEIIVIIFAGSFFALSLFGMEKIATHRRVLSLKNISCNSVVNLFCSNVLKIDDVQAKLPRELQVDIAKKMSFIYECSGYYSDCNAYICDEHPANTSKTLSLRRGLYMWISTQSNERLMHILDGTVVKELLWDNGFDRPLYMLKSDLVVWSKEVHCFDNNPLPDNIKIQYYNGIIMIWKKIDMDTLSFPIRAVINPYEYAHLRCKRRKTKLT